MSQQFVKTFEDAEDHEIFDINDFTTASDWERFVYYFLTVLFFNDFNKSYLFKSRFIVQIEELINQLKLNSNGNSSGSEVLNK